jgi:hypothetical protein
VDKAAVYDDALGKSAVSAYTGADSLAAEVFLSAQAPFTLLAAAGLPPDTDAVAGLDRVDFGPCRIYDADDLVAWNQRVSTHLPVVINQVNVTVTDTAIVDPDGNIGCPEGRKIVAEFVE